MMAETDDAMTLVSKKRTKEELAYAEYANFNKNLGNQARKAMLNTGKIAVNKAAKEKYSDEIKSLDVKLRQSELNAPREKKAQLIANAEIKAKKQSNPYLTKGEIKKIGQRALSKARETVGAKRVLVDITDNEWEAIQAGAISESKLTRIINHADTDKVKALATPRNGKAISDSQISRIRSYAANGYSNAQIAEMLGISASTVTKYLN